MFKILEWYIKDFTLGCAIIVVLIIWVIYLLIDLKKFKSDMKALENRIYEESDDLENGNKTED